MFPEQIQTPRKIGKTQVNNLFLYIVIAILTGFVLAFPVKWIWNWLCPGIFGVPEISAIQAWGLMVLSQLLLSRGSVQTERPRRQTENKV